MRNTFPIKFAVLAKSNFFPGTFCFCVKILFFIEVLNICIIPISNSNLKFHLALHSTQEILPVLIICYLDIVIILINY